jgi:hypothetical protein
MDKEIVCAEPAAVVDFHDMLPTIGVWDWDLCNNVIYGDDIIAKAFGLSSSLTKKGLPPEHYFAHIHQDDRQMIIDHSQRSIATNGACSDKFRIVSPSGTKWVNSQGRAFADQNNNPRCFVGLITELGSPYGPESSEARIFPGGSADDDLLYLCIQAKRIASSSRRPFIEYLLELIMAEVTNSQVMNKN